MELEMMDIKILVATHKQYWMPKDSVYMPLQVGAALHEDLGYTRDDSGENISIKNPNYCELTGLYWAWKNLSCKYIGHCHYRRYFGHKVCTDVLEKRKLSILNGLEYEQLLRDYDAILPVKWNFRNKTIREQYEQCHYKKDLDIVERIITEKYPGYSVPFTKVMKQKKLYAFNMFVMRKKNFDEYCAWLFDILFTLEGYIDVSHYSAYNARVYGFLSERLLNVWLMNKKLKVIEVPVVALEKEKIGMTRKIKNALKLKLAQCQGFMQNKMDGSVYR